MSDPYPLIGFATTDDIAELSRLRWELYAEQEDTPAETPDAYRERFARFARSALTSDAWRSGGFGRPDEPIVLNLEPDIPLES